MSDNSSNNSNNNDNNEQDDNHNDGPDINLINEDKNAKYRVVAAIDFGTTYSGFAYANKSHPKKIYVHDEWQLYTCCQKTPTVLKYESSDPSTIKWGHLALAERPNRKKNKSRKKQSSDSSDVKIVERFKLHLTDMTDKPYLPEGIKCEKAITDYLTEMGKVMKNTLEMRWPNVDFFEQVLIIMTVPAEFNGRAIEIMRECAFEAKLIKTKSSRNLKFTTEPEAAAIHCMNILKELDIGVDSSFLVVDCGGGTVDLTTRKLLEGNKIGEKTERKGGCCGGSFVDDEFIKFFGRKVGSSAVELLRENNYSQLQYMIQEFCRRIKFPFSGKEEKFKPFDLDLEELCPIIKKYAKGTERVKLEEDEWSIQLKAEDVEEMFDKVIEQIIVLIEQHLDASGEVSAMLLVGGFSESKYLQKKVKERFNQRLQKKISFPPNPMIAIVDGAVQFGLKQEVVATRVLKWTYGTDVCRKWEPDDPPERKLPSGNIIEFSRLAERGDEVPVNAAIPRLFTPGCVFQTKMGLDLYYTDNPDAKFCDQPEVKPLGEWSIEIPITLGLRPIIFLLIFGEVEIKAAALNIETHQEHEITFNFDKEF